MSLLSYCQIYAWEGLDSWIFYWTWKWESGHGLTEFSPYIDDTGLPRAYSSTYKSRFRVDICSSYYHLVLFGWRSFVFVIEMCSFGYNTQFYSFVISAFVRKTLNQHKGEGIPLRRRRKIGMIGNTRLMLLTILQDTIRLFHHTILYMPII